MTARFPSLRGGWLPPAVLSTTAGAVDVIVFLTLDELRNDGPATHRDSKRRDL
jgi:hypothetical protein